jgi:hypothetical protein
MDGRVAQSAPLHPDASSATHDNSWSLICWCFFLDGAAWLVRQRLFPACAGCRGIVACLRRSERCKQRSKKVVWRLPAYSGIAAAGGWCGMSRGTVYSAMPANVPDPAHDAVAASDIATLGRLIQAQEAEVQHQRALVGNPRANHLPLARAGPV